jgi:predicted phage terminase large subunit-like protein
MEVKRQIAEKRQALELETTRQNADTIRAKCQNFAEFVKRAWHVLEPETRLVWNWHLQAMCDHLEAISREKLHPRIIINIPPGCSKSTIISVMWNAWVWGPLNQQHKRYLSTSYDMENVERDCEKTRALVLSDWFQSLWPIELVRSSTTNFTTTTRGSRVGTAFRSITGKRGDILCIDDPHSLDGAESESERERAVRRFIEGGQNRINDMEKSAIVIVMQRLHEADLTGAMLAREMGYIHLCLPAEFEEDRRCVTPIFSDPRTYEGELLDPQRFPMSVLTPLKKENDYMYAGQYQQRPAPREGGMFKIDEIQKVDNVPAGAQYVRGWDIAGSKRKRSAFTSGALLAYVDNIVYIVHVERARKEIDEAEALIVETARNDNDRYGMRCVQSLPQDPGQAGKSQKFHLAGRLSGTNFKFSPESGEKADRAIPFASMVNSGNVRMVKGAWNAALENEMRNFPNAMYKDQVDSLSRAYSEIIPLMQDDPYARVAGPQTR